MSRKVNLNWGFTVMELLLAVVVIGILASFAMAGYQGYRDRTAMLVDETNQKVLAAAVKLYAYDNNALPGSLSQLRNRDMERAYAAVTEGKRPFTFLAYLEERITGVGTAEAVPLPELYYQNNANIRRCPRDPNPDRSPAYSSYQIAAFFKDKALSVLLNPANAGRDLISETSRTDIHQGTVVVTMAGGKSRRDLVSPKHNSSSGGGQGSGGGMGGGGG